MSQGKLPQNQGMLERMAARASELEQAMANGEAIAPGEFRRVTTEFAKANNMPLIEAAQIMYRNLIAQDGIVPLRGLRNAADRHYTCPD